MEAIMTVTGLDRTGIVAAVSASLAREHANIANISQTLMGEYFTMILHLSLREETNFATFKDAMAELGEKEALDIRVQSAAIFHAMHRI